MRHWFRKKDGRPRTAGTLFDDAVVMLEERVMLDAATPVVTVGSATQSVQLTSPDNHVTVHLLFDNTSDGTGTNGAGANATGYGPFLQVVIPTHGADGSAAGAPDGDGLKFNGASYLGTSLSASDVFDLTFTNVAGTVQATNPVTNQVVLASDYGAVAGDHLVVLRLPFGSFTPPQTPADIALDLTLSSYADLGTGLQVKAVAGFQYGTTPTGNTPIMQAAGSAAVDTITPTLLTTSITTDTEANTSEEVATGPNQAYTYTLHVDVATGQTITAGTNTAIGPTITATLPDTLVYLHDGSNPLVVKVGATTLTPSDYTIVSEPVPGSVVTSAANTLAIRLNNPVTGIAGDDVTISYKAYVNDVHGNGGAAVLTTASDFAPTNSQTDLVATYHWNALDPRDNSGPLTPAATPVVTDTVINRAIAIQKSNTFIDTDGSGTFGPADTVVYTLQVQLSDYLTAGDIKITDVLSDGQLIDTSATPTISVVQRGSTVASSTPMEHLTAAPLADNFTFTYDGATGKTTSTIDISQELVALGLTNGLIAGGRTQAGDAGAGTGGTTVTIVFRATVQNNFVGPVTGTPAVDQGDSVGNTATIDSTIRDNSTLGVIGLAVGGAGRDDAATSRAIEVGALQKSIYQINNAAPVTDASGNLLIKAGDLVTYRLTYTLPISSYENLNFTDFLPLPVFQVTPGLTLAQDPAGTTPTANHYSYGPNNTFVPGTYTGAPTAPTITYSDNLAGNSINFNFGSYSAQDHGSPNTPSKIDLLFTVVATDTAFADGLYLTNLASSSENNTAGSPTPLNSIVQVRLSQPKVAIQKAIVSIGSGSGTITTPEAIAGISFNGVGTATGFTGSVTDATLGADPTTKAAPNINSNAAGMDAGDTARVALIVNNEGSGANGAFDVKVLDALPAGVGLNGNGNFTVAYGDGTTISATDYTINYFTDAAGTVATADPAMAASFRIVFNDTAGASLKTDGDAASHDIIIVTYDIAVKDSVVISPTALASSASLTNYAALDNGVNQVTSPITDDATIGLAAPTVAKAFVPGSSTSTATAEPTSAADPLKLAIGEEATYTVTYTFAEGTTTNVRLSDLLPGSDATGRYEFVSATITSIGSNLTTTYAVNDTGTLSNTHGASSSGTTYSDTASFGGAAGVTVVNHGDNSVTGADKIVVTFVIRAPNDSENNNGDAGSNTGSLVYGATNTPVNDFAPMTIAVPILNLTKTLTTPQPINTTNSVTFTIDVRHNALSGTDAFDLNFSDALPAGLTNLVVTGISTNTALTTADFVTTDTNGDGSPDKVTFTPGRQGVFDLAKGDFFTLTVTANVSASAQAGATYTNTATTTYSTADNGNVTPGTDIVGERTGISVSGSAAVTIPVILDKSFSPTSSVTSENGVIGGSIIYYISATLPEGASNNFKIIDLLPAGVTYDALNTMLYSTGAKITAGAPVITTATVGGRTEVTFTFGNVTDAADGIAQGAADKIIVQIGGLVASTHARGDVLANTATETTDVTIGGSTSTITGTSNTINATVTDPSMTIGKVVNTPTVAASGDIVQYTSTINALSGANISNAQDVIFTDSLGGGAALTGSVVVDGTTTITAADILAGNTVNGWVVGTSGSGFFIRFGQVTAGSGHSIVYNAAITTTAQSTVGNAATVTYDAISSGANGNSVGDGQNDHDQSASASATVGAVAVAKTLTATSVADTTGANLSIGETATFQVVVDVPAGARTFTIKDLLDLAGVGHMTLVGMPGITETGGVSYASAPVITTPDNDGDGNPDYSITFSMGAGSAAGQITITYTATAANTADNMSGDHITVPVTLAYATPVVGQIAGNLTSTTAVDIVAPTLGIDKQIATSDPTPNAGDTVTYTVIVTNSGSGPAYGVTISDPLPSGLTYTGTPTLTVGGVTTNPASAASVLVSTLLPGQTATLVYSATINNTAVTGVPINNTATISASGTLPGGGGRAGPNPSDSTSFTVEALQGLDKAISASSDPNTGTSAYRAGVTDLHVGEVATVDLTVRLTEGSTGSVVVVDKLQLPAGVLTLTGTPTIVTANGVTFTGTGAAGYTLTDTDGDGIPDTITMNFGTVTVPGNNVSTDNFFVIRYAGTVADVPANQAGNQLDLQAKLTTALGLTSLATAPADIVAPAVTLTKTAAAGTVSRGDTVAYTISLTNSGTSPAYDLSLADVLPAGLSYTGTTTLTVGGVTTTFASPNAVTFAMLGAGQTATVSYQVLVAPGVGAAANYTNTATVSFDSLSGVGGRTGSASGTATIATPTDVIGLTKTIISTTDPNTGTAQYRPGVTDLNVGEGATIDLTASFTEGTTGSVVLTDQLPLTGKFQIVGTPTITFLGGTTSTLPGTATLVDTDGDGLADKITFNFGTVTVPVDGDPTNNLIRIRYNIVTPDVAGNVAGAALSSPAMLTTAAGNATASVSADIVAPNVAINKAVAAGSADAGDVKAYTVTIVNNGTGPAYDLTIADALPAGLTAVSGTTVLTVNGVSTVFSSPSAVPLAMLGVGQSATLTFNAVIGDAVVGGSTLTNGATVSYDSLAGPGGHAGSSSATASFTTAAVQTLDKTLVATSETFTGTAQVRPGVTDLTIGERATFELATTFSEGTTNNVVITDQLVTANGVLNFTGMPTLVLGNGVVITGSVTPVLVDTNGDGVPDQVRFNLGNVTLPGDNDPSNNFIRIRYDAVLSNVPANVSGNQLTLPATLTSSTGSLTASAPADIVAPVLTLAKVLAPDQASDGQTTAFLITVAHAGSSTASATNIVLTEMLPQGALLSSASVVSGPAGTTVNGNVITIPQLDLGQTVVVRVTTSVNFSAPPTGDTINQAGITYGTVSAANGILNSRPGSAAAQAILPFGASTTKLPDMLGRQEMSEIGSMGAYLDYRYVENFPEIDPVYSGSATPGTFVTIDVSDDSGSVSGFGSGIADAGGNWLVRLPSTTVNDKLEHSRFDRYYDGSRLFRAPNSNLFDDRSLLGFTRFGDRLSVGSQPSYTTQIVRVNVGGATDGFDPSFAPAWRDQFFSVESRLSVGGVFRDRADHAVENLYEGLAAPEAAGLNRFNREFLSTADF